MCSYTVYFYKKTWHIEHILTFHPTFLAISTIIVAFWDTCFVLLLSCDRLSRAETISVKPLRNSAERFSINSACFFSSSAVTNTLRDDASPRMARMRTLEKSRFRSFFSIRRAFFRDAVASIIEPLVKKDPFTNFKVPLKMKNIKFPTVSQL